MPVYVLPQTRLPYDLGGDSVCHGYTTGSLDLQLQDVIGRDWRGRGACVVVNDAALGREFPGSFETAFLGTVLHELAHVLERPSPYRPRPDVDPDDLRREAVEVAKVVSGPPTPDEVYRPWFGHEARFIRIAMHLWYRAKQHDLYLFPDEIVPADRYALSPARFYARATEGEAKCMDNDVLKALEEVTARQRIVNTRRSELELEIKQLKEQAQSDLYERRFTQWDSKIEKLEKRAELRSERAAALEPELAKVHAELADLDQREKELREQKLDP